MTTGGVAGLGPGGAAPSVTILALVVVVTVVAQLADLAPVLLLRA